MNKLLLLLALFFFSAQSFTAGCPDGSESVKSISLDGSYFVNNCNVEGGENNSLSSIDEEKYTSYPNFKTYASDLWTI
ncbi:hypothetical protein [Candidatus Pseudothioglobus sp. Uisw_050_01]|uniref:hypothetical protein n=1 Tax=Candidatus Pseudothioglobus sp. Uisw_050_01 TaxID=3230997 RepID=UPI003A882D3A